MRAAVKDYHIDIFWSDGGYIADILDLVACSASHYRT
jgi:hypothetical protein